MVFGWEVSKVGPISDQGVYGIAKSFADQVGKGDVQVKHGSDESKNRFTILNKILGVGVEARVEAPIKKYV